MEQVQSTLQCPASTPTQASSSHAPIESGSERGLFAMSVGTSARTPRPVKNASSVPTVTYVAGVAAGASVGDDDLVGAGHHVDAGVGAGGNVEHTVSRRRVAHRIRAALGQLGAIGEREAHVVHVDSRNAVDHGASTVDAQRGSAQRVGECRP